MSTRDDLEADSLKQKGMRDMYYVRGELQVYLPEFARDVAMYGKVDSAGVMRAWDITPEDLAIIVQMPIFKKALDNYKTMLAESDTAIIQLHAEEALEAAVITMKSRITSGQVSDGNLVAMTKILTDIVGAKQMKVMTGLGSQVNTGTVIQVSYADVEQIQAPDPAQAVNATWELVKDQYDYTGLSVDNYEQGENDGT